MNTKNHFITPAIGRSIETQQRYVNHLAAKKELNDTSCDLCESVERQRRSQLYPILGECAIKLENPYFTLIDNDYPYSVYDGQEILVHHMLVPRAHVDYDRVVHDMTLRHAFADAEAELLDATQGAYGTNMARSSSSVASSINQHAHKHFFVTGEPITEQYFSIREKRNDFHAADH